MKISEAKLRRIIRNTLLRERAIANASDLANEIDFIEEWSELLLDELQDRLPNGIAMTDWSDKTRQSKTNGLRKAVSLHLVGALGYENDSYSKRRDTWKEEEKISKRHQDEKMRGLR